MNCPYCFIRPLRQQKGAATCGDPECVRRNNNSHKKRLAMQRDNIDAVNSVVVFDRQRWCYVRRTPPSRKRVRGITYEADFSYVKDGEQVVIDVKGVRTEVFRLKAKLFMSQYPDIRFEIVEA